MRQRLRMRIASLTFKQAPRPLASRAPPHFSLILFFPPLLPGPFVSLDLSYRLPACLEIRFVRDNGTRENSRFLRNYLVAQAFHQARNAFCVFWMVFLSIVVVQNGILLFYCLWDAQALYFPEMNFSNVYLTQNRYNCSL